MIEIMTPAQAATFREQRLKEEQRRLADKALVQHLKAGT